LKQILAVLALTVAVGAAAAGPARAGDIQNFTIHNKTGLAFKELYVEPMSNKADWGEEMLKGKSMANGEATEIDFKGFGDECKFGIRVVDSTGQPYEVDDVDLCKVSHFSFVKEGGEVKYEDDSE
jgi:hypothetical protein